MTNMESEGQHRHGSANQSQTPKARNCWKRMSFKFSPRTPLNSQQCVPWQAISPAAAFHFRASRSIRYRWGDRSQSWPERGDRRPKLHFFPFWDCTFGSTNLGIDQNMIEHQNVVDSSRAIKDRLQFLAPPKSFISVYKKSSEAVTLSLSNSIHVVTLPI